MNTIKQRIIGAIVLVSLAVIFVPMLFEAPHPERVKTPVSIPPAPEVPGYTVKPLPAPPLPAAPQAAQTLPAITGYTDGMARAEQPSVPEEEESSQSGPDVPTETTRKPDPVAPKVASSQPAENDLTTSASHQTDRGKDTGTSVDAQAFWQVKVGTFSKRDNAIRLRDALRNEGIKAWTEPMVTARGETWLRVWAGPVASREDAERLAARIDKKWKTRSRIIKSQS